jgi:hypothetical protein
VNPRALGGSDWRCAVDQWLTEYAELIACKPTPAEGEELDILALLARDPESGLVEIAPGVWAVERTGGWSAR